MCASARCSGGRARPPAGQDRALGSCPPSRMPRQGLTTLPSWSHACVTPAPAAVAWGRGQGSWIDGQVVVAEGALGLQGRPPGWGGAPCPPAAGTSCRPGPGPLLLLSHHAHEGEVGGGGRSMRGRPRDA